MPCLFWLKAFHCLEYLRSVVFFNRVSFTWLKLSEKFDLVKIKTWCSLCSQLPSQKSTRHWRAAWNLFGYCLWSEHLVRYVNCLMDFGEFWLVTLRKCAHSVVFLHLLF